jgi:hypothetical protein
MSIQNKTNIMFDTMIYRAIGEFLVGKTEKQKSKFKHVFFQKEKELKFKPLLNIVVLLELLGHFKIEDIAYNTYKEAILFAIEHSPRSFLPPPDIYFLDTFFGYYPDENKFFLENLAWVIDKIFESKGNDDKLLLLRNNIDWLSEKHYHMEEELLFNMRKSIKYAGDENRPNVDSIFAERSNKEKRKPLLSDLNNADSVYKHQANSYLTRLSQLSNILKSEYDREPLIEYFVTNHRAAFEKIRLTNIKMVGNKDIKLGSDRKKNDISDILIIMALNPSKNNVLVTRERKNIKIINDVGLGEWVISQEDYFNKVNLEELKYEINILPLAKDVI